MCLFSLLEQKNADLSSLSKASTSSQPKTLDGAGGLGEQGESSKY